MAIVLDVVFALAESVPELDCPVARAGDNLTVVGREADGEDIGGVANKAAGGVASVEVPQAQRVVPRGGEGELAVRGNDNIRYEVVVPVKDALRVAILDLVAAGELPNDDRLVYAKIKRIRSLCQRYLAHRVAFSDTRRRRKWETYRETQ